MLKFALAFTLLVAALPAMAQHQILSCADCRAVQAYPRDFGNYAFNMLIEPLDDDFSIFTTYSTSAYVWNRHQQYALVELKDVLEDTGASIFWGGFSIPIRVSSDFVRITVQDQYGEVMTYEVFETSRPLVVGDGTTAPALNTTDPIPASEDQGGGETTILCCQEGTYYWYYDQEGFFYSSSE